MAAHPKTSAHQDRVQHAFDEFVARHRAGRSIQLDALTVGLDDQERRQLLNRLEDYVELAPRRPFRRGDYSGSRVAEMIDEAVSSADAAKPSDRS